MWAAGRYAGSLDSNATPISTSAMPKTTQKEHKQLPILEDGEVVFSVDEKLQPSIDLELLPRQPDGHLLD